MAKTEYFTRNKIDQVTDSDTGETVALILKPKEIGLEGIIRILNYQVDIDNDYPKEIIIPGRRRCIITTGYLKSLNDIAENDMVERIQKLARQINKCHKVILRAPKPEKAIAN